jgi:hypothetical protein
MRTGYVHVLLLPFSVSLLEFLLSRVAISKCLESLGAQS